MNRKKEIEKLKSNHFDICVIGAGASGAGVALDAVLRGYKVALIDKGDFSGETSSKSTKLIHGGVRYLEQAFKQLDFSHLKQVKHGLAERKFLLQNAPHLSKPLGIITPVNSWFEGLYYYIGLRMYGWFAKSDSFPKSRWLSKKETLITSPNIKAAIHSSVMYFDGQLDDARYNLALVQSAHEKGTTVANYLTVESFLKDDLGKIKTVVVKEENSEESFKINAAIFVNCTGPFSDSIRKMANDQLEDRIVASKGVHIVLPRRFFKGEKAMLIPKTKDGRLVFVIPFKYEVMVGTTDTPYSELALEPVLQHQEVNFLLETLEPFLNEMPKEKDVIAGFGGLRPLLSATKVKEGETKSLLRDHEVEVDSHSGLVSLLGGKWTTYRLMAQDTMDKIDSLFNKKTACTTDTYKLIGARESENIKAIEVDYIEKTILENLLNTYGDQTPRVLNLLKENSDWLQPIHPSYPYLMGQVVYACRNEMVYHVRDFLSRRIRLEIQDWAVCEAVVEKVSDLMASELGWSNIRKENEINSYTELLSNLNKEKNK
jgi:glycerol-3-phosphate dehydrogenase